MRLYLPMLTRSQYMILASLSICLILLLVFALVCVTQFFSYRSQVADLQPKLARLQGMLQAEDSIRQAAMSAGEGIDGLVYASEETNTIGVNMQQKLRMAFSAAGMTVNNSNILNAREFESFTRVGVSIGAEGTLPQLEQVLAAIIIERPVVLIERIDVSPERRRSNETSQNIDVKIQLFSLKLRND